MSHRRPLLAAVAVLAVLAALACGFAVVAGANPALAQGYNDLRAPLFERQPRYRQAPPQYQRPPVVRRARPPVVREAPPAPRGFFETLFGGGQPQPRVVVPAQQAPTYHRRPYYRQPAEPERRARRRTRPSEPAIARRSQPRAIAQEIAKPKVNPSTFVVVFGDAMAQSLAEGLDAATADNPDLVVTSQSSAQASLAASADHDMLKAARAAVAPDKKITFAVAMIGANDRVPIADGATPVQPGSERWKQIYSGRVSELVRSFVDKKIPLVWVGLPPVKDEAAAGELAALNIANRAAVERAGGVFVDVWEAFVDADNRYSAYGPNVAGETVKLRGSDGASFTKAGERKLAHFVNVEIKRMLDQRKGVAGLGLKPTADPKDTLDPAALIDRQMTALPEPPGTPGLSPKPIAGPVFPLSGQAEMQGGAAGVALIAAAPKPQGDGAVLIDRVYGDGRAVDPRPGRADDFRWPKASP